MTKEIETREEQETKSIEKIRAELNIEKRCIWLPSHTKTKIKQKVFIRETIKNNKKVISKIIIAFNENFGNLNTTDQKVYYALIKIWEQKGRPLVPVKFTLRELARMLNLKWAGRKTIEVIKQSLMRLRGTVFVWEDSFYDSETKKTLKFVNTFTILSEFRMSERTEGEDDEDSEITIGFYKFHDLLLKNLMSNYTKPLLLDVVLNFKSEIAQILYTHLDLILADKYRYERRLKELFEDLGLEGEDYQKPSVRKRIFERIIPQLIGVRLSTGFIISAAIERTKDGKDYKLVVQKGDSLPEALPETAGENEDTRQPESSAAPEISEEEAEARLNALSDEEHRALRDRVAAKVLEEHPILRENSYSNILGRMISRRMREEMK